MMNKRKCRWEVAVRNPTSGNRDLDPYDWFDVHPCRTNGSARELAKSILLEFPWLITAIRPRSAMNGLEMRARVERALLLGNLDVLRKLVPTLLTSHCQLEYERLHKPKCTDENCWCRREHG